MEDYDWLTEGGLAWHRRLGGVQIKGVDSRYVVIRTEHADDVRIYRESVQGTLFRDRPGPGAPRRSLPRVRRATELRPKCDARGRAFETFCAIDFEVANTSRTSACAVALVRVEAGCIVERVRALIRPPPGPFDFTWLHGISEDDVAQACLFNEVWREISHLASGIAFFVAHNAGYDQSVLWSAGRHYGMEPPSTPFACTVRLAREVWNIRPTALPDVCDRLDIPLRHHDPLSDATAAAMIVLRSADVVVGE